MGNTATAELLATLFEGAPRFVRRLGWSGGESTSEVLARAEQIAHSMREEEQIELLNSHPRIGAPPSSVSTLSYREQGYDQDSGTAELRDRLERLNEEYERRFGFRFVVFVEGRSRAEIADVMQARMFAPRAHELARGLSDVIAIARDRLKRLEQQGQ